jgi:NAD(P)-dependent dehydrogenase (short-subunit alcohol dehydrogenase family)
MERLRLLAEHRYGQQAVGSPVPVAARYRIECGRAGADLDAADSLDDGGESVEKFGKNTPLGRPGQPAEVAPAYVLLASSDGSYITGAMIPVTGGRPML